MVESPRDRRLRSDRSALEALQADSTILEFDVSDQRGEHYTVRFHGLGFWRPAESEEVLVRDRHEVQVQLGAGYPRTLPGLSWCTPVFHPNISAGGVVCLGGYGTHWAPSLDLAELCEMLWDMIRYRNFDVDSPYNREAAQWARDQSLYTLPIDPRPIRDKLATNHHAKDDVAVATGASVSAVISEAMTDLTGPLPADADIVIVDQEEVVEAEILEPEDQDIVFLD